MSDEFTFNARQYVDFSKNSDDITDDNSYFEVDQEAVLQVEDAYGVNVESAMQFNEVEVAEYVEVSDPESDCVFFSPMVAVDTMSSSKVYLKSKLRRSMSSNDINNAKEPTNNLENAFDQLKISNNDEHKSNSMRSLNRVRFASNEHINRLAQPKYKSQENLHKNQFISLAEGVNKFQLGTPKRFRNAPKLKSNIENNLTKPHSPKLLTTRRTRPATAISKEEQEKIEFEEAKKFKIKAHPVNKKILRGPLKAPALEKKPTTAIEPFQLTEVKKKEVAKTPVSNVKFHAQPVPKSLHHPFKINKPPSQKTEAHTPKFSKRFAKPQSPKVLKNKPADENEKPFKPTKTEPVPFSFEQRHLEMKKKKEELIAKVLEEEKKAREFHANPVPKAVLKSRNCSLEQLSQVNTQLHHRTGSFGSYQKPEPTTFKAKPAAVLKMKPFEPKKDHRVTQVAEFHFNTDERKEYWEKQEQKRREKEEMIAELKKKEYEEQQRLEEEERAKLRKQAEIKAQPIKKFKPVIIAPSLKITEPIEFNFHSDKNRRKIE